MERFAAIKVFFDKCIKTFPGFSDWMRKVLAQRTICECCGTGMQSKKFYPIPLHYSRRTATSSTNYAYVCKECCVAICADRDYYRIVDRFLDLRHFESMNGVQTVRLTPEMANLLPKRPIFKSSVDGATFRKSPEYQMLIAVNKKENCEECGVSGEFHPAIGRNVMGLKFVSKTNELTLDPSNYKTLCGNCAKKSKIVESNVTK